MPRPSIKHIVLLLTCLCFATAAFAQSADDLFSAARNYIAKGDYSNAILVLNRAIELSPDNLEYREELAYTYYLNGDNAKAGDVIRPLLKNDSATAMTFQIAGDISQAAHDQKGAEKLYKRGLHQFPNSGELHNDLGQLYFNMSNYSAALRSWVEGIKADPNFSLNYYNAARMYYYSNDKVWAIIYGEMFLNLEGFTTHSAEIKGILLEAYKKLFDNPQALTGNLPKMGAGKDNSSQQTVPDFRKAFLNTLGKNVEVVTAGITPETLVMLRTRFLLDWNNFYSLYYPFTLFSYQTELLRQGLFGAYNQWIFGPAANYNAFKNWVALHKDQYDRLVQYLQDHPLKFPDGQFYNTGKIEYIPSEDQQQAVGY